MYKELPVKKIIINNNNNKPITRISKRHGDIMKKSHLLNGMFAFILVTSFPTTAMATLINLFAFDSGNYTHLGEHDGGDQKTLIGQQDFNNQTDLFTFNSYAMFDLSIIPNQVTITSASITYEFISGSSLNTNGTNETLQAWDVGVNSAVLDVTRNSGDGLGQAIWADIGGGINFGSDNIVVNDPSSVVHLNTAGLNALNVFAAGGANFGIGSSCPFCSGSSVFADENITFTSIPVLSINYEVNAVPLPPALWLLGSGLIGLFGVAKKSKRSDEKNL